MSLRFLKKLGHAIKRDSKGSIIPNAKNAAGALVTQASRIE